MIRIERGDRVFEVTIKETNAGQVFSMYCRDIATGSETLYEGAGDKWRRTVKTRRGRSHDWLASAPHLVKELQSVAAEASS